MKLFLFTALFLTSIVAHADICSRSPEVVSWLENQIGRSCSLISDEDLSVVKKLDGGSLNLHLKSGDLDGLYNLEYLDLGFNSNLILPANIFKDLGSLKTLYLNHCYMRELVPDTFAGLTSLEFLNLHSNWFLKIEPGYFAHLGNLRQLVFGENPLSKIEGGAFQELTSLEDLKIISDRDHFFIDEEVFASMPNLKRLQLEGSFNPSFVNAVGKAVHLESLAISATDLSQSDFQFLKGLSALRELMVEWSKITSLSESLFSGNPNLEGLSFTGNPLTSVAEGAFANLPLLQYLDLWDTGVTGESCMKLKEKYSTTYVGCDHYSSAKHMRSIAR